MKKLTLLLLILLTVQLATAQSIFQKTFSGAGYDYGFSIKQTTDTGYIILGQTNSFGAGNYDVFLIKADAHGDTLWTKTFGGTDYEYGHSVNQTSDGGYIIVGTTSSFGSGFKNVLLIKIDTNGDTLWTKAFGGSDYDFGYGVQQTTDGGYIVAGNTGSFSAGDGNVYLFKTDASGTLLWTKTFGGTNLDVAYSVQQTTDGGYIVTGTTTSFGAGDYDFYLIKTDAYGDTLWAKTFGGTGIDQGRFVQQTTDGGYIIVGATWSFGAGNSDIYLIKTDANGDTLWTKTFGGTDYDYGYSAHQTTDGGYIITGTESLGANTEVCLIKTDGNGDTLWVKTFGGIIGDLGNSVNQTGDGGYIIAGTTFTFGPDIYIIKADSLGNSTCNQSNPTTTVTNPATIITTPVSVISSPFSIEKSAPVTVGSGGIIHSLCTPVTINEITADDSFTIYPNPSNGRFIITFKNRILKGKIKIENTFGTQVFLEDIFEESQRIINLKNISGGVYFVNVCDGEKSYSKKLIVGCD